MLRSRSRAAVSSKQALGSDRSSVSSPAQDKTTKPISSFLGYPRFFGGFLTKTKVCEVDALMNSTSPIDMKSIFTSPFGYGENIQPPRTSAKKRPWETLNSTAIGLALITFLDEIPEKGQHNKATRMVTFTTNLKVQIPPNLPATPLRSPAESPYSHYDFGTKTGNQQLTSPQYFFKTGNSPVTTSHLSIAEMELSEDYTRVISHGPNQTTTHIFGNCIVKSSGSSRGCSFNSAKTTKTFSPIAKKSLSDNFLSRCYTCTKSLSHKKDIYIYRGDKAFCSQACRAEEMQRDGADYDD